MDMFLIASSIALLSFGILLILFPGVVKKISDWLNTSILPVEDKMRASNVMGGVVLIILSVVIFYISFKR